MILLVLACATEPSVAVLPPGRLLRRVSIDLRGTLPSIDELEQVEEDPAQIGVFAAEWIEQPAFEELTVQRLAERWHTRVDTFPIEYTDYPLDPDQEYGFERSVGEEPLRLAARIVADDLAWEQVVTADFTLANALLDEIWPIEADPAPESDSDWVRASYTDERPAAGVLTTNGLWWRYDTTVSNLNRGRISAVTRILLCEDYLSREVSFAERDADIDPALAVLDDPACQSCHSSLDPAAAALMGFWWVVEYSEPEFATYHPERERLWDTYLQVEPAWHGEPISGPVDLGAQIAADPRFAPCAVSSTAEAYWRRTPGWEDEPDLAALREVFDEADHRIKPLILALMEGEAYQADDTRLLAPYQLESIVSDLVGLSWVEDGVRMLDADTTGMRVLAGGVDGYAARTPQTAPGLTRTLVLKRVAEMAAGQAMGSALLEMEITDLHRILLGQPPTDEELAELQALESAVGEIDPDQARAAVLTTLLRDASFVAY